MLKKEKKKEYINNFFALHSQRIAEFLQDVIYFCKFCKCLKEKLLIFFFFFSF